MGVKKRKCVFKCERGGGRWLKMRERADGGDDVGRRGVVFVWEQETRECGGGE